MSDYKKLTKEKVDYSEGMKHRCGNCTYYKVVDNECERVRGYIQAKMWCKLWKAKQHATASS